MQLGFAASLLTDPSLLWKPHLTHTSSVLWSSLVIKRFRTKRFRTFNPHLQTCFSHVQEHAAKHEDAVERGAQRPQQAAERGAPLED